MLLPVNTLRQPLQRSEGYYDIRDRLAERLVPMDAVTEGVQEGCKFTRKISLCVRVGAWLALELRNLGVDPRGSHRDEGILKHLPLSTSYNCLKYHLGIRTCNQTLV